MSLNESRVWRRARLVSLGQQVWSFESSYQSYSNRFAADGRVQSLGDRHARAVTWKQLLDSFPEGRSEIRQLMNQRGLSESDNAATAAYQIQRAEVGMAVDWAYGLTSRWMIGFQVPLVYRRTKVNTAVQLTPALAVASSQQGVKALQNVNVQGKVKSMAESELANSGYDAIPDERASWDWGDISLMSQFMLAESYRWSWALQQTVRWPTARNPSVGDYLQTGGDDGQVDVGLGSLLDYRVQKWTLGWRMGYVMQLPDTLRMRVPTSSRLAIDPSVRRDLGDWMTGALDTEYRLTRRLQLNLEYAFLSKTRDKYQSGSESGARYASLGENSEQEVHQTRVGFLYQLGDRTERSGVESKTVASVGYTYPLMGRNSVDASRASVELISYF
ncbi:MAG: hypothetical protein KF799_01950 [Bdellovibrionales bacterium]|nr:hypothetical protein [Bdellovibrionales bacterium]